MTGSLIDSKRLNALVALAQLIKQPTRHRARQFLCQDWTNYPRIRNAGLLDLQDHDLAGLQEAGRRLIRRALRDLLPDGTRTADRASDLELMEAHLLTDHTWDSLATERSEKKLSYICERSLKGKQRQALELVLHWATEAKRDQPALRQPARRMPHRLLGLTALGALLLGLIGGVRFLNAPGVLQSIPGDWIGTSLLAVNDQPMEAYDLLSQVTPPLPWPRTNTPVSSALVVDSPVHKRRVMAVGYRKGGPAAGQIVLWDPDSGSKLWVCDWQPELANRLTHDGVTADVMKDEVFWPRYLAHSSPWGSLGGSLVAVYWSRFSPCFVVFIDLATGKVSGTYVHPGVLQSPIVIDFPGVRNHAVLLAGCDNIVNRPALVAVPVVPGRHSASNVAWNPSGEEDALFRVLPPDDARWRVGLDMDRARIARLTAACWSPTTRTLTCAVGRLSDNRLAYYLYLNVDHGTVSDVSLHMGDSQARRWRDLGIDPEQWGREANKDVWISSPAVEN